MTFIPDRLSVAPMMDWTDRHFRYFLRRFTKETLLYTEMLTAQAVVFGEAERLLAFHPEEKKLVLQLGGSDPELLAKACRMAQAFEYEAINLNAGCPSERVAAGCFGAALRQTPALVVECMQAMQENSRVPVTIKTRISLEEMTVESDGYDNLAQFVALIEKTGCDTFIIHARKARLKGLTPKQNRERPALRHDLVYRLKQDFPHLKIVTNGNVTSLEQVEEHLEHLDGVMIGRAAYAYPHLFAEADRRIFGKTDQIKSRIDAVLEMEPYIQNEIAKGCRLNAITRHMMGVFHGCPGAAYWRRHLTEKAILPGADFKTVAEALKNVISSS